MNAAVAVASEAMSGPAEVLPAGARTALARAVSAADRACRDGSGDEPERARWRRHARPLVASLERAMAGADPEACHAIVAQLDDIVDASRDDLELLRRLLVLASHTAGHLRLCGDPRVPADVRRRARTLQFRLFDRLARVGRDPELARLVERRNQIFVDLGLRPRSIALLDWCDVAVRIAVGSPLRDTLARLSTGEARRLLAAKVRFDLLAIELNIALDDLADDGRQPGLFARTVERVLGPTRGRAWSCADSAVGRYFADERARAEAVTGPVADAHARYLALIDDLCRAVVEAGREVAGDRWDDDAWSAQMVRIVGAMALSLIQNARPELLADADWPRDFAGPDRLAVQAANSNRVVFELVGLWCHERVTGQAVDRDTGARLRAAFEELQIAQQLGNCLATLERELDEGDRSNCVVERAVEVWHARSAVERAALIDAAGLTRSLAELSVPPRGDDVIGALYRIVQRADAPARRATAIDCLRRLVEHTGAVGDVFDQWSRRVDAAAHAVEAAGWCGASSRQAQIDLLVLHLALLGKSPLAASGERT